MDNITFTGDPDSMLYTMVFYRGKGDVIMRDIKFKDFKYIDQGVRPFMNIQPHTSCDAVLDHH